MSSEEAVQGGAQADVDQLGSIGTEYLLALFDRHGVARHKRAAEVQAALGLSYNSAHRRLNTPHEWTLEDLAKVAKRLGESLSDLFDAKRQEEGISAVLVHGLESTPCTVWLAKAGESTIDSPLVAVQEQERWVVRLGREIAAGTPARAVSCLRFLSEPRRKIAVLDDDRAVAEQSCAYLAASGFEATAFNNLRSLSEALSSTQVFDGFIIDWLVGKDDARSILAEIRNLHPHAAIALLSGKVDDGLADAADVADASATFQAPYFQKPAKMPMIVAMLKRLLLKSG